MTKAKQRMNQTTWVARRATAAALALAIVFALTVVATQAAQAQTYDAAADFEQGYINQSNPNGVWSYGYSLAFTDAITLYDYTEQGNYNGPNAQFWLSSIVDIGNSPSAEFNDGPAYDDGNVDFLPYEFLLVSGIGGQYSNLVFTAPADGMYSVSGSFRGCQYGIGVVVGIVVNGNVIFNSAVGSEGQVVPFDTNVSLKAGDTVRFSVGPNGGLQNTGLAATITKQSGSYTVLHNFTGRQDGGNPYAGLTIDKAGKNLYGTALYGGNGYGTVYQLKQKGSGWVFNRLYSFGGNDGAGPGFDGGALLLGSDGTLYGTTNGGGESGCQGSGAPYPGCGVVYSLGPAPRACVTALCPWTETVLYRFKGGSDGYNPEGSLAYDQAAGNIYGTTIYGGNLGAGTVYELTASSGYKDETVTYTFGSDGMYPISGVILDSSGNFYGTTYMGGLANLGTAYQLVPSNGGLTENLHYSFSGGSDGSEPIGAGLTFDQSGNLYGAAPGAGVSGGGTIFELSPGSGGWTFATLYSPSGSAMNGNGCGVWGLLVMHGGSLYGTTKCDGAYGYGNVFELSPSTTGWIYADLYDFTGGSDGAYPISNVVFDGNGNLYGTTYGGGTDGYGVVWEITP